MKLFRTILLFYIFFCDTPCCFAQTSIIDSLKRNIWSASTNKDKCKALLELCRQKYSLTADSLYQYASTVKKISQNDPDGRNTILADYYIAYSLLINGMEDSSLKMTNHYLE